MCFWIRETLVGTYVATGVMCAFGAWLQFREENRGVVGRVWALWPIALGKAILAGLFWPVVLVIVYRELNGD